MLDLALPRSERKLVVDGQPTIEASLCHNGGERIVHLVNKSKGVEKGEGFAQLIMSIPPTPPCHVSLKMAKKPAAVTLQPGARKPLNWRYANGRVEIDVPGFAVHEIVALTGGEF